MLIEERVASLEVRMGTAEELLRNQNTILEKIWRDVRELSNQIIKHKGFVGGIIFTISALWGIFILGFQYFLKTKGGG